MKRGGFTHMNLNLKLGLRRVQVQVLLSSPPSLNCSCKSAVQVVPLPETKQVRIRGVNSCHNKPHKMFLSYQQPYAETQHNINI